MKIETSKIKKWTILDIEGKLFKVVDTAHTHMGRGGATDTFKVKDIVTGATNTFTYKAGTVLEEAEVQTNRAIYLYNAGESYSFMENDTGEMHEIDTSVVDDVAPYLKENLDVHLMVHEGNVLGVILPASINYVIEKTVPGVKGDRAQAGKKPATLETWLEVMVSLHKNEGDTITLNTLTGDAS